FLAVAVVVFGVWMSTHHDGCRRSLTLPVICLGGVIFLVSIIGFLGALKNSSILLWIYLILLCFILVGILVFTVLAFIVTNNGSGHSVDGLRCIRGLECELRVLSGNTCKGYFSPNSENQQQLRGRSQFGEPR
ncbi:Tetraspanin/Peripherin, partial [Parasponia andersonii]